MAVRDDFSAGEVLAAADLNDTFASKPTFTYGTATPTADADGAIWYDENETPPVPKFWDGSAWQPFSTGAGDADFSNSATGTYTDSGVDYKYVTFTSSGTLTVTQEGFADVLVVGGGGGGSNSSSRIGGGGGGCVRWQSIEMSIDTYSVTIGAGGAGTTGIQASPGNSSSLGNLLLSGGGGQGSAQGGGSASTFNGAGGGGSPGGMVVSASITTRQGGGQGGTLYGSQTYSGIVNTFDGGSVERGKGGFTGGAGAANTGNGGWSSGSGGSGIVIVRVKV